jgi:hypothetical protein
MTKINIGGFEFNKECPEKCCGKYELIGQGGTCHRCPIFNCVPIKDEKGEEFSLLDPEEYRTDWAKIWYEWFKGDMKISPNLYLRMDKI